MIFPRNRQLVDSLSAYDLRNADNLVLLSDILETLASNLARDKELRVHMGSEEPEIWLPLVQLWSDIANAADNDEDGGSQFCAVTVSLGKMLRNLVADVPLNQKYAFATEPFIRRLVHIHTSWTREKDETSHTVARILTQTLSNIVTTNDSLQNELLRTYLALPEEQSVLIRLLASPDPRTVIAVLVLLLNCVRQDRGRAVLLCTATTSARMCIVLLDRLEHLLDAPEESDEGKAFELGYTLLTNLFEYGLFEELYVRMDIPGEAVAPPQTTLLKLLDSHLQSAQKRNLSSPGPALGFPLVARFFALSGYAQRAVRAALGDTHGGSFDLQLPAVCAALVLVAQSLLAILLLNSSKPTSNSREEPGTVPNPVISSRAPEMNPRQLFSTCRSPDDGMGFVESLLETLRLLDVFLPRIQFGKPAGDPRRPASEGVGNPDAADGTGFAYLKRDLVRLLGALVHEDRSMQDRVRMAEGIPVVLNLCVVDERNPYLREHAIFALRNLLHRNAENQAAVEAIKPMGTWDEEGILRDVPGATRR
ncbi:spinocerebellar ataxia type 10 protein domain-containing protein [Amylostereum chailletii]|nr:spinocerebellar ataxia type 10 protein domain-containing protein [Amylostereum chailletii]